ncbi:MAG: MBL fold metallo-hydrolase [Marinoscillum sp.]|uniref:MBL fold metallo-hydrolase n=2 Tax=Marinoscillum sp. TaxID=2024838 RepID=UPI0032F345D0
MKALLPVLLLLASMAGNTQPPAPDYIPANHTSIKIQPILHGTLMLEWNGEVIYSDPYGGASRFQNLPAPSMILITDIHGDHLNPETLLAIDTESATFVVPQAVADQLPEEITSKVIVMKNGESRKVNDILIMAVPMYNLPESEDSRHTRGRGNGYVLHLGGKNIYISGDTEDITEMRALKDIDVAFVCMNLPYTMDIDQAASAVLEFRPAVVYPFHYRGQGGLNDIEGFKQLVNKGSDQIDVRLRNWYSE